MLKIVKKSLGVGRSCLVGAESWLPLWLVEMLEKLEFGVIFEKGLEKLEKDIIFKAVELEKLDFHIWVRNIFMKCFTCMFIYL